MKAFIGWPIEFRGYKLPLHVTCKYLGDFEKDAFVPLVLVETIKGLIEGACTRLELSIAEWEPIIFECNYVLELSELPSDPYALKKRLDVLRVDDYPSWRPHISVPYDFWRSIKVAGRHQAYTPADARPGWLTLYIDGQEFYRFP